MCDLWHDIFNYVTRYGLYVSSTMQGVPGVVPEPCSKHELLLLLLLLFLCDLIYDSVGPTYTPYVTQ